MRSEKTTDIFGNEKTVHYDDSGRKVGETRIEKDWLGNEKAVHYDQYGRKTGTSEVRSGIFGDKVEHFDQYGHKIGESRDESNWFGDKTVHYDRYGRKTGESREESGIFRGDYTSTRGSAGGYYPGWPSGRGGNGSSGGSGGYSGGGSGGYSGGYAGEGGVTAAGVLITLLGLAVVFLFSGTQVIPTMKNNKKAVTTAWDNAQKAIANVLPEGFPLPARYAHRGAGSDDPRSAGGPRPKRQRITGRGEG